MIASLPDSSWYPQIEPWEDFGQCSMDPEPVIARSDNTPPPPCKKNYKVSSRLRRSSPSPSSTAKVPRWEQLAQKLPKRSQRASMGPDAAIHCRAYLIPSWLDHYGVNKKRKLIEAKGIPSLKNWRFITLTCRRSTGDWADYDSENYGCDALTCYLNGSERLRRFLLLCRESGLWKEDAKWCWKFEFQRDGFPHWHLLVERLTMFSHEQLALITKFWGLGRTNVRRVNLKKFRYDFKYAFKTVRQDSDDGEDDGLTSLAPAWFLDYSGSKTVLVKWTDAHGIEHSEKVVKPCTFARARFWQTSRGFYTGKAPVVLAPKPPVSSRAVRTVRTVLSAQYRSVQAIARLSSGQYLASAVVTLRTSTREFWNLVGFDCEHAGALGLGIYSFMVHPGRLTTPQNKWQITQLSQMNRLTLDRARHHRSQGQRFARI